MFPLAKQRQILSLGACAFLLAATEDSGWFVANALVLPHTGIRSGTTAGAAPWHIRTQAPAPALRQGGGRAAGTSTRPTMQRNANRHRHRHRHRHRQPRSGICRSRTSLCMVPETNDNGDDRGNKANRRRDDPELDQPPQPRKWNRLLGRLGFSPASAAAAAAAEPSPDDGFLLDDVDGIGSRILPASGPRGRKRPAQPRPSNRRCSGRHRPPALLRVASLGAVALVAVALVLAARAAVLSLGGVLGADPSGKPRGPLEALSRGGSTLLLMAGGRRVRAASGLAGSGFGIGTGPSLGTLAKCSAIAWYGWWLSRVLRDSSDSLPPARGADETAGAGTTAAGVPPTDADSPPPDAASEDTDRALHSPTTERKDQGRARTDDDDDDDREVNRSFFPPPLETTGRSDMMSF